MQLFWAGDFKLDQEEIISVRVSAKNAKGWSDASSWNVDQDGADVQKVPRMMNPPQAKRNNLASVGQVDLSWNLITDTRRAGGVEGEEIETYVMQWKEKTSGTWEYIVGNPDDDATDLNNLDFATDTGTFEHTDFGTLSLPED